MSKPAAQQREQPTRVADDSFPQPWTDDADLTEWEVDVTSDDQGRGPPLATVIVDLDADQTAWIGREADRAGLTLVDFVKKLIDDARAASGEGAGQGVGA